MKQGTLSSKPPQLFDGDGQPVWALADVERASLPLAHQAHSVGAGVWL